MIHAYFDGSCEPVNPGGRCGYGAIAYRNSIEIWKCSEVYVPERPSDTSNNLGEYLGFLSILKFLKKIPPEPTIIYGDSNLVIMQMKGIWRIKSGLYEPVAHEALLELKFLLDLGWDEISICWITRRLNSIADALSRGA